MNSPFPGMDPYLEDPAYREDFHRSFITYLRDALLEALPPNYDARIDQRIRLVDAREELGGVRLPDVAVTHQPTGRAASAGPSSSSAVLEPVIMAMPAVTEDRDVWIDIFHLPERSLVTVIEVLSPTNKSGEGASDYRNKRIDLYSRHVNLVEIDLLLGGERLTFRKPLPRGDYYAVVARDEKRPNADVYAWTLRDPLPEIPVPLKSPDPDVHLALGKVFATAYERGRYARRLRYQSPPPVQLGDLNASWASELVNSAIAQLKAE
jgi:hypothetical protein